jgi:streptogramin lyase
MPLRANEVFVPGAYPLHTYVTRAEQQLETSLRDALDTPGQVVSLSGPSKSGKTVLVEKVVGRDLLISLSGASIRHPDEVWQKALDWMDVPNSTSTGRSIGGTVGAEVTAKGSAGLPLLARAELGGSASGEITGESTREVIRDRRGLPQVVEEIANSDFVMLIDDFHYMDRAVQIEVAKSLKEAVRLGVKIVTAAVLHRGDGVNALALDSNGSLWVGLVPSGPGEGLGRLEKGVFTPFVTPGFDGSKLSVFALTLDRDGSLWVGTIGKGLFSIRGDVVEHYGRAEGLSSDFVNDLFADREGILWVTTTNGIDSFRDPRVATFSTSEGLGSEEAVGVLASRDGTVWVANADSLDEIKNGTVTSIRGGHGLPADQVSYMLEDRAGNLWIGVYDGLFVSRNGRFRRIAEPDHQPLGLVLAMTEDSDGNIWAECSGKSRRLIRIRDFQIREQFPASQIPAGHLARDPSGGIWIGPGNGTLVLFRDGVQKKFPIGSTANLVTNHLNVQADGSVMASFDDGIVGLRQGKAQRMTTKNGLPCNAVYSFIEDKQKSWWLLTECGIVGLPDSELQRWWANPEAVVQTRLYDALDGARPGRYGIRSADVSPDGRV